MRPGLQEDRAALSPVANDLPLYSRNPADFRHLEGVVTVVRV